MYPIAEEMLQIALSDPYDVALPKFNRIIHGYVETIKDLQRTIRELEKHSSGDGCKCTQGTSCKADTGISAPCDSNVAHIEERELIRLTED